MATIVNNSGCKAHKEFSQMQLFNKNKDLIISPVNRKLYQ